MRSRQLHLVAVAVTLLWGAGRVARAGDPIVVESYEGARPADADALLKPIYAELEKRGYIGGDKLAWNVRSRVSSEPGALSPSQIIEAQKNVERGYQHFIDGDYVAASTAVEKALAVYASAPGVLSHEDAVRALEFRALLIAARSAEVEGKNDDAFKWVAEAIRTFPNQLPATSDFDPRVLALYRRVSDELVHQGGGTIEIRVSDPAAVIFINEHFVGTGHAKLDQLPAGRYRVYVAKADRPGRVHVVEIAPRGVATLDVSWELDAALSTAPAYVAVTAHGDDMSASIQLAHAVDAPRVVVLGIRTIEGRRAVVGYGLQVESQTRSYAAVQIEPLAPPEETMRRIGALLAGDKSVSTSNLITREPRPPEAGGRGLGPRRKIALGVVVVSAIAGGVAIGFDLYAHDAYDTSKREVDDAKQADLFETSNRRYHIAQGLAVAGVAGIAAAAAIWFTAPSETERLGVAAVPTSNGLSFVVSGRF